MRTRRSKRMELVWKQILAVQELNLAAVKLELVLAVKRVPSMKMLKTLTSSWHKEFRKNQKTYVKLGCQVGGCANTTTHITASICWHQAYIIV